MSGRLEYRRLRAPAEDGGVLIEPAGAAVGELVERNLALQALADVDLAGISLRELRRQARADLLAAAAHYTGEYVDLSARSLATSATRIYLAGHQPELSHPGVWLKNFVLDALARRDGAVAIQLLIDNDEVRATSLRVPTGSVPAARIEQIDFDQAAPACPWEERAVLDRDVFRTFAERVKTAIAPLVERPLVESLWREAAEVTSSTAHLGACLARLRHRLERSWGLQTWELPLSQVCDSRSFHQFVAYLLGRLPQLIESHNRTLVEYRQLHRLRSRSHPVPDLASDDRWLEAPLWLWTSANPQRRRAFVRCAGDGLVLSDRNELHLELPDARDGDASSLADALGELAERGIKLRPRALITTMYARLVLSDLFIHGIGGAKYDQITDCLIEDLFGVAPPGFLTVSGTRLLPIERPAALSDDLARIDRQLRDLRFRAEEVVDEHGTAEERAAAQSITEEKRHWLAQSPAPGTGKPRQLALERINAQLAALLADRRNELLRRHGGLESEAAVARLLGSREFSFCLYPEATLRPWLLDATAFAT